MAGVRSWWKYAAALLPMTLAGVLTLRAPAPPPIDLPGKSQVPTPRPGSRVLGAAQLRFEANRGQTDKRVDFLARGSGYGIFLTGQGAVFSLRHRGGRRRDVVRMSLVEAHPSPAVEGIDRLAGATHYLKGSDPEQWIAGVPAFARVRYQQVYPGVDLVYYGRGSEISLPSSCATRGATGHRDAR